MNAFPNLPDGAKVLSVSELNNTVRTLLEEGFPSVWVTGEVSNLARPSSGHQYFSLKDSQAQLRSVIWRGIGLRLRVQLKDGMEVIARGRLTVYVARGDYQLIVEEIHPRGFGALELALRQLKERLFALGYFDPRRKKPLPPWPRRVALVTSPSGAAVRDMLEILGRRWPAVEVWICPVRVQGDGAAQEIAAAIGLLNRLKPTTDVIIVGRGGGSAEDLWAFNEEVVAHALFASRIPVVSAVGHEIDLTIADLVADRRALTPSEAAELVVPNRAELSDSITDCATRLRGLVNARLERARRGVQDLAERRAFRLPLERIRDAERRLDELAERLARVARQRLERLQQAVGAAAARLETLSPLNVLGRGYSLTRSESGQVIRDAAQVRPGGRLETLLHRGRLMSRVEEVAPPDDAAGPRLARPTAAEVTEGGAGGGCIHE
jgi:exodeoxyribonuclease VII large subunit